MKKITCLIAVLLVCFIFPLLTKAQSAVGKEEMMNVFKKINNFFTNTSAYSLTVTHASYENYTTPVPVEKSTGYFKKQNENYHSFLLGIHTVQNSRYKFVIDTSEQVIMIQNPDQLTWINYTSEDYLQLLKNATAIRMTITGNYKFYRIELPADNPIAAYEFLVDEEGLAKEIIWYYNKEVKKDQEAVQPAAKPRASISFSNYKKEVEFNYAATFSEDNFFKNVSNKLVTTDKYHTYKIRDQRVRN